MKKILIALLVLATVVVLVSCKSTASAPVQVADSSSIGDWWNNPPEETSEFHYEVGVAKGSTAQISRDWAKANVNTALAQYINNAIDAIVVTYINDAGEVSQTTNNMQAMQAFEELSKQRAQAVLTGVNYVYHAEPDGTVYVLAKLPIGPLAEELKTNIREAYVKNKASEEANRMMNEALDKYFN